MVSEVHLFIYSYRIVSRPDLHQYVILKSVIYFYKVSQNSFVTDKKYLKLEIDLMSDEKQYYLRALSTTMESVNLNNVSSSYRHCEQR